MLWWRKVYLSKLELMHDTKICTPNKHNLSIYDWWWSELARRKQLSISDIFADLSVFTMMKAQRNTVQKVISSFFPKQNKKDHRKFSKVSYPFYFSVDKIAPHHFLWECSHSMHTHIYAHEERERDTHTHTHTHTHAKLSRDFNRTLPDIMNIWL